MVGGGGEEMMGMEGGAEGGGGPGGKELELSELRERRSMVDGVALLCTTRGGGPSPQTLCFCKSSFDGSSERCLLSREKSHYLNPEIMTILLPKNREIVIHTHTSWPIPVALIHNSKPSIHPPPSIPISS